MITTEQMRFSTHPAKKFYHQQQGDSPQKNRQFTTLISKSSQENL